ncbi:hypothetical protein KP005_05190 [Geomonas nitrogeniifigens]|uniref:DUF6504 domain-containing protein n=1 Tax=Geomonas diazotrophica TaxID=2843197 RepID=A0ABX8JLP8_9BACT|nr:DUF6504 family protein [Geomonas nitrogeniifigens]QWV98683.1 hypothetical protein KP005_05190 [Geomonas nitrogeniifigens]
MGEEPNVKRRGEPVKVSCYAGYKADERPTAFTWRDRTFTVTGILDRWYDRDGNYFKVQVEDGGQHQLRHDLNDNRWELLPPRDE